MMGAVVELRRLSRAEKGAILADCWRILGGEYDPLRVVWDEQATPKDRRLLLLMAGKTTATDKRLAGRAWCDLSPACRSEIRAALAKWREWAERLQ